MADLLFECFGFNQTIKADANSTEAKQLNPNINSHIVILPLKLVFSVWYKYLTCIIHILVKWHTYLQKAISNEIATHQGDLKQNGLDVTSLMISHYYIVS